MSALQESRRELMVQLEGLMRLLKVRTDLLITWKGLKIHMQPRSKCRSVVLLLHFTAFVSVNVPHAVWALKLARMLDEMRC